MEQNKPIERELENAKEVVKKSQEEFNKAKKKTDDAYKEYKKLRGSIFNRDYKKLKKIYKNARANQKLKSKDLKLEKNKLDQLKAKLRDATNRLRVASSI